MSATASYHRKLKPSGLVDRLHKEVASKFTGIVVSKHFIERGLERYTIGGEFYTVLKRVLNYVNKELCILLFNCAIDHQNRYVIKLGGIRVPCMLDESGPHPRLLLKTIYTA